MSEELEDVLADERGQAAVLRHNGHPHDADLIERICARVASASESYTRWLSESEAHTRSGKSPMKLRATFPELESEGLAKRVGRARYYRMCAVPQRRHVETAREAGRRAARANQ